MRQQDTFWRHRDTFWRGHPAGIFILEASARWVADEAAARGHSLHDYVDGHRSLTDLGVTVDNAVATLQPLIPADILPTRLGAVETTNSSPGRIGTFVVSPTGFGTSS